MGDSKFIKSIETTAINNEYELSNIFMNITLFMLAVIVILILILLVKRLYFSG